MVFPASQAQSLTNNTIAATSDADIQLEITLCEQQIRNTTGLGLFKLLYNAKTLGNPKGPPQISNNLSDNQTVFYNLLVTSGYVVSLNNDSRRWEIDWAPRGPETLVAVYSFRTTVTPGAIYPQTIAAIKSFFAGQIPIIKSVVTVNGDISESDFNGTDSVFYEYTAVVDQEFDDTDFSTPLAGFLTVQGLGYDSNNCTAYKLI